MKPISAMASRRPSWQNPQRLRQVATGAGALVLLYLVLVLVALFGGPRIGSSFLPLPGGGPDPANPVAGLEPGRPTQNVATIPRATPTPTPTPGSTPSTTPLPPATTPGATSTNGTVAGTGGPATSRPTPVNKPTRQVADQYDPTIPVTTKKPPTRTTAPPPEPTHNPTTNPPSKPTNPPTTPDDPPTTPDDPGTQDPDPNPGLLGTLLGALLGTLGL